MNAEIKKWKNIILSGKRIEPRDKSSEAYYAIAEYLVMKEKIAA